MTLQGFYTNKGRVLAAKIAAGTAGMTVTRIVAGSGHTADIPSATTLPSQKQTLHTGLPSISGSTATLPVTLLEAEAAVSYSLTELGVYASDPDAGEILFQVYQLTEAAPIAALGQDTLRFYLRQSIGAAGVSVTCSPTGTVLEEDITELRARAAYADHTNLLDNPWFIHPINQRGEASGATWGTNKYGLDRWYSDANNAVKWNSAGYLVMPANTDNCIISQKIESRGIEAGTFLTASVLSEDGTVLKSSFAMPAVGSTEYGVFYGTEFSGSTFTNSVNGYYTFRLWYKKGNTTDGHVAAVKLELGRESTLANDTAPNCASELAKCQRYFQIFKTQSLLKTDRDDFRPVMRTNPATSTITIGGSTYYAASADL